MGKVPCNWFRLGDEAAWQEDEAGLAVTISRQPLKLALRRSGLAGDPFISSGGNQAHNQEVVPAKAGRVLPCVSVFVCSLEGDVEHRTFVSILTPNARAYGAVADFVNGLVIRFTSGRLIFHDVVFVYSFSC